MEQHLEEALRSVLEFDRVNSVRTIQELWAGYGAIQRVELTGAEHPSVIVKCIAEPESANHPRGWNTDAGHARKLRSYEVEGQWYQKYNERTDEACRTAHHLGSWKKGNESFLILEDLDASGYELRKSELTLSELRSCLSWLAHFHAKFMHDEAKGLWPIGTYWHWGTRKNEWESMPEGDLKTHAPAIDEVLNSAQFQCIVHGDAKFANFCFSENGSVAAVDFQYVGRGCGIKDVVYLLSCIPENLSESEQEEYLHFYFSVLNGALNPEDQAQFDAIETEWRALYPFAWADFERFLQGWAPGHWKSNQSIQHHCETVISNLQEKQ